MWQFEYECMWKMIKCSLFMTLNGSSQRNEHGDAIMVGTTSENNAHIPNGKKVKNSFLIVFGLQKRAPILKTASKLWISNDFMFKMAFHCGGYECVWKTIIWYFFDSIRSNPVQSSPLQSSRETAKSSLDKIVIRFRLI